MIEVRSYVLVGRRDDLERVKSLGDAWFVRERVLLPAIGGLLRSSHISSVDAEALRIAAAGGVVRSANFVDVYPGSSATRSQAIRSLVDRKLLERLPDAPRSYRLALDAGPLVMAVVRQLEDLGFVPAIMRDAL